MISSFLNGCLIGGILLGICFLIAYISSKAEKEKTVEEALSRSGYKTFSDDLWLDSDFCIDKTQKLLLVARCGLTIIPASSLRNVSHQIIYDYKTENNASFSQGLADGVVSGITGVGIIREIREEQVEYVKEVILKIDLDYKGNFTKVISTNLETATNFTNYFHHYRRLLHHASVQHLLQQPLLFLIHIKLNSKES